MIRRFLLGAAVLALGATSALAETADDVIAKYIQAQGGVEKIHAIQSIRMTGKAIMGQGMEVPMTRYAKRPNKTRVEFTFQGMNGVQAFDGTDAWAVMPMMGKTSPELATAEESRRTAEQADIDGPLVGYKEKGNTVELVGKEPVDGADAYHLKVTLKDREVRNYFIDAETGLIVKVTGKTMMRGSEMEFATTMSDYKSVDGHMVPFTVEQGAAGSPMKQKLVAEKVEFNTDLPDSLFAVPANAVRPSAASDSLKAAAPGKADEAKVEAPKTGSTPAKKATSTKKKSTGKQG